jgi:hypothetical protein
VIRESAVAAWGAGRSVAGCLLGPVVRQLLVLPQREKPKRENSRENPDLDRDPDSVEIEIWSLKQVI